MSSIRGIKVLINSIEKRPQIDSLTGLRFLAASLVVFHHLRPESASSLPDFLQRLFENGSAAVNLFFVLSGFVLTYANCNESGVVGKSKQNFWFDRAAKLYLVYLLGMLLFAPFIYWNLSSLHPTVPSILGRLAVYGLAALSLTQAWFPATSLAWNGPGWSLSAEAFFYLLFPIILPWIGRLSNEKLKLLIFASWMASVATTVTENWLYGGGPASAPITPTFIGYFFLFNPALRLPEFIVGISIGILHIRKVVEVRSNLDVLCAIALCVLLAFAPVHTLNFALVLVIACLVFTLACSTSLLAKVLSTKYLVLLGNASYALYIFHIPLSRWMLLWEHSRGLTSAGGGGGGGGGFESWCQFAIYFLILVILATAVYLYVEKPSCNYLRMLNQARTFQLRR